MFKKLGLSTIILSALLLNGCGGGGSDSDINSGNNRNDYGYYGGDTRFGDYTINRFWSVIDTHTYAVTVFYFGSNGAFVLSNDGVEQYGIYGVSENAKTIRGDVLNDITIKSNSNFNRVVQGTKVQCYNISGGDRPLVMCPDEEYYGKNIKSEIYNISENVQSIDIQSALAEMK